MKRSGSLFAAAVAVVVISGVLLLRYRPALPARDAASSAAATAQRTTEAAYPPASIDGRPEPDYSTRTIELCGYGPFEARVGQLFPPHLTASADLALAQAITALAVGNDPRQRAGALYVQAAGAAKRARQGYMAQHPDCGADAACLARSEEAGQQSFALAREALVADAVASRDPAAYALAYYACIRRPRDAEPGGSCRLASAAQWAQLDPNNLIAWAHAAWEAQSMGDADARAEALRRAAGATESSMRFDAVLEPLAHANVRNLDPATRSIAQSSAMGVLHAVPVPGMRVLREECASKAPSDEARRQFCDDVGRVLTQRGSTMMELSLGVSIGERSGWPEDEVRALRERRDAYRSVLEGERTAPWTCEFQRAMDRGVAALLTGSELKAADQLVEDSGHTPAELAQQHRARYQVPATQAASAQRTK